MVTSSHTTKVFLTKRISSRWLQSLKSCFHQPSLVFSPIELWRWPKNQDGLSASSSIVRPDVHVLVLFSAMCSQLTEFDVGCNWLMRRCIWSWQTFITKTILRLLCSQLHAESNVTDIGIFFQNKGSNETGKILDKTTTINQQLSHCNSRIW